MTTTDLIKVLKKIEFSASGRPREISFLISDKKEKFIYCPNITLDSTGDGVCGSEVTLKIEKPL